MTRTSLPLRALSVMLAFVLACTAVPFAASSKAYADETVYANQYSITAPIFITFGDDEPYDAANPQHSLTQSAKFENSGSESVLIQRLSCYETDKAKVSNILTEADKSGTPINEQPLFSFWNDNVGDSVALNFNHTYSEENDKDFFVGSSAFDSGPARGINWTYYAIAAGSPGNPGTLNCKYRLNLTNVYDVANANAKVDLDKISSTATSADSAEYYPLALVKYTFAPGRFYLTYQDSNDEIQVKTLAEVKNDAVTLSKTAVVTGENDQYKELVSSDTGSADDPSNLYKLYKGFIEGDIPYTCWVLDTNGNVNRQLRIIGINHDNAVGGGKAGLTLQIVDNIGNSVMNKAETGSGTGTTGWPRSTVYTNLRSSSYMNRFFNGATSSYIVPVEKSSRYSSYSGASKPSFLSWKTTDTMFILSGMEYGNIIRNADQATYPHNEVFNEANDGFQYSYYAVEKRTQPALGWTRSSAWGAGSVTSRENANFMYVTTAGDVTGGAEPTNSYAVYPAFCL